MKYTCTKETTVLEALTQFFPDSTRNTLRDWIREGRVHVDGVIVKTANYSVKPGAIIEFQKRMKREGGLPIVYEDEHLVVVDKPAGLLSVATDFELDKTAHAMLKVRHKPNKVYVIHRLDQETSGLLMFALSEPAYNFLKQELMVHAVERTYYGIAEGHLQGHGQWVSYLKEDASYKVHASSSPAFGEKAVTNYEGIVYKAPYTLVRFQLETGKKNQIRVQTAANGNPLAGDEKYGATSDPLKRLCLHAHELRFLHPITKKPLHFVSPLPAEFLSRMKLAKLP